MTQLLIDRATLEQAIDALRIAGELNHQRHCGYKTTGATEAVFVESTTKAIITLRAALAGAELDTTQRDAELWRAYKARKDAAINAGMGKSVVRTGPMEWSEPE